MPYTRRQQEKIGFRELSLKCVTRPDLSEVPLRFVQNVKNLIISAINKYYTNYKWLKSMYTILERWLRLY